MTEGLRPCQYSGHHSFYEGKFHKFTEKDRKPHVILEDNCKIYILDLTMGNFEFTDKENK